VTPGPPGRPVEPVDVPTLVSALRAAGKGPTGPARRDPRTGRIVGGVVPLPRRYPDRPASPFDDDRDDDVDPSCDLDDFDDVDGLDEIDDDDFDFNPDCDCPDCIEAAARADVGDDPVLLAQLSALLEASPDDADDRITVLDGARRDGRPLLIAYEHPRTGPATDVFRVLTVTGTTAHLSDNAGRERLIDVEWIEAILETATGARPGRSRGRRRGGR
jgi:hypothetical protein